jgi:hypothetical protein
MEAMMDTDRWSGWAMAGGMIMILVGIFRALAGFIGLFNSAWVMRGFSGYYITSSSGVAWWTMIIGVLLVLGGLAVLAGRNWGRWVGIIFVGLAAISELFWIPIYPFWSIMILVLLALVFYGLVVSKPIPQE